MSSKTWMREYLKAQRQQEREAKKRLRELERRSKELAKLSAMEQARLEVETYEGRLDVLLSMHKECGPTWNWKEHAASLPPLKPTLLAFQEASAQQWAELKGKGETELLVARERDERDFQEATASYNQELGEWSRMKSLALRILDGAEKAYTEALVEFSGLGELSNLGSSIHFTVHSADLVEGVLTVKGQQAIPCEMKSLTRTGKVSVKKMPKPRFHEIYQDYVCGCVFRVAREVFAVLPIKTIIITACAEMVNPATGHQTENPVLSVAIPRAMLEKLNFENIDPSDALENFTHVGDAKASRKSGEFLAISPLNPEAFLENPGVESGLTELFKVLGNLKAEIECCLSGKELK